MYRQADTYKFIVLVISFMLLSLSPVEAQSELKLTLDTSNIRIGEQLGAKLILSGEGDPADYWLPVFYDTLVPGIEIISQDQADTIKSDSGFIIRKRLRITSFDSGNYVISGIRAMQLTGGDTSYIKARPVALNVFIVTVEEGAEIRDIYGPYTIPVSFRELLPWILIGLGVLVLAVLAWLYYRHRKTGKPIIRAFTRPKPPAHIVALEDLESLRRKKLWQEGKFKSFHSELTEILRRYLDERFGIPAMEMVTEEIISAVNDLEEVNASWVSELDQVFVLADFVKFAKAEPLPDENDSSLRTAGAFVRATIPASFLQEERNEVSDKKLEKKEDR